MNRSRIPAVELLEGKALLSAVAPVGPAPVHPPIVVPINQGLVVNLTTNQTVYHQGQPVNMTLTETNTSNHPITVDLGPSIDGFYVTQGTQTVWASNEGPQPQYILVKTLQPGESVTLTATWNGQSNTGVGGDLTGPFVVHSQVAGSNSVPIVILPA